MSHQIRNGAFSVVIKKCPLASIVLVRIFFKRISTLKASLHPLTKPLLKNCVFESTYFALILMDVSWSSEDEMTDGGGPAVTTS